MHVTRRRCTHLDEAPVVKRQMSPVYKIAPRMAGQKGIHSVDLRLEQEADTSEQDTRFAAERRAFWAMHPQLLKAYEGKYVAMLNGKVVDCDEDQHAFAKRVYRRFGY
jgi:hypothetical protein